MAAPAAQRREAQQVMEELNRMGLLAAFADAGVITPTSLDLSPIFKGKNLEGPEALEQWAQLGVFLGRIHRSAKWWIGDWLNWGEGSFGERYAQAADSTGLSFHYLQNIAWVARNVMPSRRRDGVAFSLHAEVAKLPPDEQTRWLDAAVKDELTQRDLRHAIKAAETGSAVEDDADDDADHEDRPRPLNAQRIYETARAVAARAQRRGEVYEVPAEQFDQLRAALGVGE